MCLCVRVCFGVSLVLPELQKHMQGQDSNPPYPVINRRLSTIRLRESAVPLRRQIKMAKVKKMKDSVKWRVKKVAGMTGINDALRLREEGNEGKMGG